MNVQKRGCLCTSMEWKLNSKFKTIGLGRWFMAHWNTLFWTLPSSYFYKQDLYETGFSIFPKVMPTKWLRIARPKRSTSLGVSLSEDGSKASFRGVEILKIRRWTKSKKRRQCQWTASVQLEGNVTTKVLIFSLQKRSYFYLDVRK